MRALHLFFLPFLTALLSLFAQVPSLQWDTEGNSSSVAAHEVAMRQGHQPSLAQLIAEITEVQEEDERHQSEDRLNPFSPTQLLGVSASGCLQLLEQLRSEAFHTALIQYAIAPPARVVHGVYRL